LLEQRFFLGRKVQVLACKRDSHTGSAVADFSRLAGDGTRSAAHELS
jgi:hypothetical protein